jgi:thiol-disulfide isomerase/thioredoxin
VALALGFVASPGMAQQQLQEVPMSQAPPVQLPAGEDQDLAEAVSLSNRSAVDFIRELERFLLKYPESKRKDEITRALFKAARDVNDDRRIALYGEKILAKDPTDISVLAPVGRSLNALGDRQSATRALEYGQRLEKKLIENGKLLDRETNVRERGQRRFELDKNMGEALVIEANALDTLGRTSEGIDAAQKAFQTSLSAEAARTAARLLSKVGRYDEAIKAAADAFSLSDSREVHAKDRRVLSELYARTHGDEKGLGDIVLASFDRISTLVDERSQLFANTPATKPGEFQLSGVHGNTLALKSLKGKVVILDFWATWCQPCRVQHPIYEQVKQRFKGDDRVVFLAINSDQDRSLVPRFVKEQKWDEPSVYYDDGLTGALSISSLPTTVLLDRNGDLFSKMTGFTPGGFADLLTDRIKQALASNGSPTAPIASQAN